MSKLTKTVNKMTRVEKPHSKPFQMDTADVTNLAKNAVLVGLAASVTYFAQNIDELDMGFGGVFVVPFIAAAMDYLVKWLNNNVDD